MKQPNTAPLSLQALFETAWAAAIPQQRLVAVILIGLGALGQVVVRRAGHTAAGSGQLEMPT